MRVWWCSFSGPDWMGGMFVCGATMGEAYRAAHESKACPPGAEEVLILRCKEAVRPEHLRPFLVETLYDRKQMRDMGGPGHDLVDDLDPPHYITASELLCTEWLAEIRCRSSDTT